MSTIDDGGPAFPTGHTTKETVHYGADGMTLRDWFAGRFMQAMADTMMEAGRAEGEDPGDVALVIAGTAYLMADTMLAVRKECK